MEKKKGGAKSLYSEIKWRWRKRGGMYRRKPESQKGGLIRRKSAENGIRLLGRRETEEEKNRE